MTEYGGEGRRREERRVRKWKLQFQFKQFLPHLRPPESFPLLDTSVFFLLLLLSNVKGGAVLRTRTATYIRKWKKATKKANKKGIFRERRQFLATRLKSNIRTTNENLATSIFRASPLLPSNLYIAPRSISYIESFLSPNYQTIFLSFIQILFPSFSFSFER